MMGKLLFRRLPVGRRATAILSTESSLLSVHHCAIATPASSPFESFRRFWFGKQYGINEIEQRLEKKYTSVAELLAAEARLQESNLPGLYSVPCEVIGEDGGWNSNSNAQLQLPTCYYAAGQGAVQFRHGGKAKKSPPKLFLVRRDLTEDQASVFLAGSGGGKTADIVGTAASRGMSLTLVICFATDIAGGRDMDKETRNQAARESVADKIRTLMRQVNALKSVIDYVKVHDEDFSIAVGIDEAGSCPILTRGILGDLDGAQEEVREALGLTKQETPVAFSIGGTGASRGTIGSRTDSFELLPTSFSIIAEHGANILDHFLTFDGPIRAILPGCTDAEELTSSLIKERLPVVFELASNNGRMTSILVEVLRSKHDSSITTSPVAISESSLLEDMMIAFMKTNGLKSLLNYDSGNSRRKTAAQALAVHLFSWKDKDQRFPLDPDEMERWASRFECGIKFADGGGVGPLATDYGLVEPRQGLVWRINDRADRLYVMNPSQILVALYMLGVDPISATERTPLGLVFLSTHIVKCAIAAAITIEEEKRPSIYAALTEIGFMVDKDDNNCVTERATKEQFESMEDRIPIPHESNPGFTPDDYFWKTLRTNVEMDIAFAKSHGQEKKLLLMDKNHAGALEGMVAGKNGDFSSPVAAINYGSSSMGDGFVSFKSQLRGGPTESIQNTTIVVQAKDYGSDSSLLTAKLNSSSKLHKEEVFTRVFGDTIFCVAGRKDVVVAKDKKQCDKDRKFIPFAVDHETGILRDLLASLAGRYGTRT